MKRFQARAGAGRFTRNTPENTLGLHIQICPHCNRLNPSPTVERDEATGFTKPAPLPTHCHVCGKPLKEEVKNA